MQELGSLQIRRHLARPLVCLRTTSECFLPKSVELTWLSGLHVYTILILQYMRNNWKKNSQCNKFFKKALIYQSWKRGRNSKGWLSVSRKPYIPNVTWLFYCRLWVNSITCNVFCVSVYSEAKICLCETSFWHILLCYTVTWGGQKFENKFK